MENGRGKGVTAPFCPIEITNPKEMGLTHEPRKAGRASRLAPRPQEKLNRDQKTLEAGGRNLESPAYSKQDDEPST